MQKIVHGEALDLLDNWYDDNPKLVYIDPPFNTKTTRVDKKASYQDIFSDYKSFLYPILKSIYHVLSYDGSLLLHLDYREVHYAKVWLDEIFGRTMFRNEIIWNYDFGGRSKTRYSPKHDNILWYTKSDTYTFNFDELKRIPYITKGGLVSEDKLARGKTITDVIWHTIVPTQGFERVGYPTQKPLGLIEQFVKVHSNKGDLLLDCFCGSGTFGVAAKKHGRSFILSDESIEAIRITTKRLEQCRLNSAQ